MILDGQNVFSDLANGDQPTAVADNASASVIDQQGKGSIFTEGGSAEKQLFVIVRVQTAGASSGSGTIQAVLQDSPDNVTYTDRLLGAAIAAASVTAGTDLLNQRLPVKLARYVRVIYRIATAVFQAGKYVSFLVESQDIHDLSQRQATGTVAAPSGALDESANQGVLGQ